LAGLPPDTPVKVKSPDAFFKDATREESWHDDQEKAEVQRFKQLVAVLKENLADVKVFLAGGNEADAFIVGRTESGWAGLRTRVVQTWPPGSVPGWRKEAPPGAACRRPISSARSRRGEGGREHAGPAAVQGRSGGTALVEARCPRCRGRLACHRNTTRWT